MKKPEPGSAGAHHHPLSGRPAVGPAARPPLVNSKRVSEAVLLLTCSRKLTVPAEDDEKVVLTAVLPRRCAGWKRAKRLVPRPKNSRSPRSVAFTIGPWPRYQVGKPALL